MTNIVVSLTSIPPRFPHLKNTLDDLLNQSIPITEVRINIPNRYRRFPDWDGTLPSVPRGVRISRAEEDFGPATKVLPTLLDVNDDDTEVIFCDDDHHYDINWAQRFVGARTLNPTSCIAAFGYDIDERVPRHEGSIQRQWTPRVQHREKNFQYRLKRLLSGFRWKGDLVKSPGYADIFEGVAGVMVKPSFFPPEVYNIPDVLWTVDDPWLSGHLARNQVPIWVMSGTPFWHRGKGPQHLEALYSMNYKGYNREAADSACIEYFQKNYNIWK